MKNLFDLTGKVAVVIGGSRGLGKGMARGLADAGATVVISSRGKEALLQAAAELTAETGSTVEGIALDITSVDAISAFVDEVVSRFGKIDILINSAGINIRKPALEYSEAEWNNVTDTQFKYVFFMNQAVGKVMVKKGIKGRIINVGSISSMVGLKNMIAYCSSKGAITQMTKALANEWAQYGMTEMTKPLLSDEAVMAKYKEKIPMGRLGTPEDMATTAVYLAADASSYVTGQMIYVDGGWLVN